jgi:hypothetical protein
MLSGPSFLDFSEDSLCDLCLLCSAPEKGIHRRDAENFVFSLAGGNPRVTLNKVGCKEGRARRENLFMFPLFLCVSAVNSPLVAAMPRYGGFAKFS